MILEPTLINDGGLDWRTVTAVISAMVSMVSAILGPLVAYKIVSRSVKAGEQKDWLQSLRADLSKFVAQYSTAVGSTKVATALIESQNALLVSIILRLNPQNVTHQELETYLKRANGLMMRNSGINDPEVVEVLDGILVAGRAVFTVELQLLGK